MTTERGTRGRTRRDRVREATIAEIKATALELMRTSGSSDVRFADIARAMEITPPGLYRYFPDRDALLTALIADAYADLADRLESAAGTAVGASEVFDRFCAVCAAYRQWAQRRPECLALTFGAPLPGYAAPEEAGTTASAHRAMAALRGTLVGPERGGDDRGLLQAWAALHGVVVLEVFGHLSWMGPQARDSLFEAQVRLCFEAARPGPQAGGASAWLRDTP